jgi:hypothetical protein
MKNILKACVLLLFAQPVLALEEEQLARQQARKLYLSLTGVTPNTAELDALQEKILQKKYQEASLDIIDQRNGMTNGGAFYNVTVKDMVTPWTNKDKTTLAPLNDLSATVIGWVRDEKQFNKILFEDSVYKAAGVTFKGEMAYFQGNNYPSSISGAQGICQRDLTSSELADTSKYRVIYNNPHNPNDPNDKKCRITKYSKTSLDNYYKINALYLPHLDVVVETNLINTTNDHYESLTALGLNLGDPDLLIENSQENKIHQYPKAISGILTTRAYGAAFVVAGTNRAPVAYAIENFLCKDMNEMNDTTIPDHRNRRDVDRSPGGTSEIYKNRCVGCHAGMDALAGAFAYYDYVNGKLIYTPGQVVSKMNHNVVFPQGFVTQSDQWMNLWTEGQNASLKWGEATVGEGVRSLGQMLSETEAFHSCMAQQVYKKVCLKPVTADEDKMRVAKLTQKYKSDNFNMKNLFINTSIECMGD